MVINSYGQAQLALRTGATSTLVPNVMDYDNPPPPPDAYVANLRSELGIDEGESVLLQPTRVVPRKRIERAIELASRLDMPTTLLVSHASGDEGSDYASFLQEKASRLGVKMLFADEYFGPERGVRPNGGKLYSLGDAYAPADIVTYPSDIEGFGNAFLEAVYFGRPLVMCAYDVYKADIEPKGFRVVSFEDYVTADTVRDVREVLQNRDLAQEMAFRNFAIAKEHYSFTALERLLVQLLDTTVR